VKERKAPAFKLRGVMLDPGRVIERKEYYTLLLPWLAEWGYNLVHLHLIDDERCALGFPSHPELASPGAFSAEEMREFVELARSLGLAVMPEIEALGHSRLIFSHRRHRHLAEPPPKERPDHDFNALCPAHPGTRKLLTELLRDLAGIFDYPAVHVGLDEVQLGSCPRCRRKYGARAPDWKRYADHARWVHAEVRKLGRRPAMWGDHVTHQPEIMKHFGRDVLMFNWDYAAEYEERDAEIFLSAGFETVACPALSKYGTVFAPYAENLANMRTTASRSLPARRRGLLGLVNTVWCPWRYLPGAVDYGLALGGHLFTSNVEDPGFAARFAARFYGLRSGNAIGAALESLYDSGLDQRFLQRLALGRDRPGNAFGREDQRRCRLMAGKMKSVIAALKRERGRVRRNRERYGDVILAAEGILALARYGARGRKKGTPGAKALYERVEKAWARDRHPGDPLRFAKPRGRATQSMLYVLRMIR